MGETAEKKREPLHKHRLANQQTAEFYADGHFVTRITLISAIQSQGNIRVT